MQATVGRLRELLFYSPADGRLHWRQEKRAGFKGSVVLHAAGEPAGCARRDGRMVVRVDGRLYLSYRVAWAIHFGEWPREQIDHINGDHTDDRLHNLRCVPFLLNAQNKRSASRGKKSCGLLGVYANKRNSESPWRACIGAGGKTRQIGVFKTPEEAHAAYIEAKRRLHEGCTL